MKRGPKPRLITEEFLAKVEHLAARGLSQQQVCHALGFSETWWYDAKQQKIRIYRRVSKEDKPKALPRSQTQSMNRL